MALTHIGAPFQVVFIDLRAKPDWYPALVPTAKVPALLLATPAQLAAAGPAGVAVADRELVFESLDILARLDADFPGVLTPPGTDAKAKAAALALADKFGTAGYGLVRSAAAAGGGGSAAPASASSSSSSAPPPPPPPLPEARAAFEAVLGEWEALLASTPGPFVAGPAVSLADFALAPMAERLASTIPASPAAGTAVRGRPDKPAIEAWFGAMEAVPAYAAVRGDPATHRAVFGRIAGLRLQGPPYVAADPGAAGEAAAKLAANRAAIVADTVKNAGLAAGTEAAVEAALLRVAGCLVGGGLPGPAAEAAADNAVTAAVCAFLPARVSAPRDMSGGAAVELRSACARVLEGCYTGI
jgi:glutathione S-transferase